MKSAIAITTLSIIAGIVSIPLVWGDSDYLRNELEEYEQKSSGVAPVSKPLYSEECSGCHMAYPPGLLTARSWTKVLDGLEDHFGDNAEIDAETRQSLADFLVTNSADNSEYRRSRKFSRSIQADNPPLRISETPYFRDEHDELPMRMVSGNPKVKSFSQCNACHSKAEKGSFNEHDINIPNYGRWDD